MAGSALPSLIQARLGCCFLFFYFLSPFLPTSLKWDDFLFLWLWQSNDHENIRPSKANFDSGVTKKRRNWFLWPIFHSRSHLTSYSLLCDLRTMTFLPKIWRIYREILDTLWLWRFLFHWYLTEYSQTRWRNSRRWLSTISLSTGHDMTFKTLLWLTTAKTNHWQNYLTWLGLD